MKKILFIICVFYLLGCSKQPSVKIVDGIMDEGQECLKIETSSATYFYQKEAGGFSSVLDKSGTDWLNYNKSAEATYPASAASDYRGLPNLIFRSDDGGAGHPGFDKCISTIENSNTIRTKTKSGKWEWTWEFFKDYAKLSVVKTDSVGYWFLYEGTPAGRFHPEKQFWGTNSDGLRTDQPDHYTGNEVYGNWQWVCFGDSSMNRIFYCAQAKSDETIDHFSYLGNTKGGVNSPDGMVVFGFGRDKGATPLLRGQNSFIIGFLDLVDEKSIKEKIEKKLE